MEQQKKIVFISWAPYCSRSDNIAREFGGKSYMVYYPFFGSNYFTIAFKYLFQTLKSLFILFKEKPNIIFCMSPPIFTTLPAWIYTKIIHNTGYVIDYHTSSFVKPIYVKLFFIQKFFAKRAITNIVTNSYLNNILHDWKVDSTIISDIRVEYNNISEYKHLRKGFNVVFVSSFSYGEPLEVVLDAFKRLTDQGINLYVTGSLKEANKEIINKAPANVLFTDFLSYSEYAGLLKDADVVMALGTVDNTMQRGAYEAMALEKPIIISDWKILRETFSKGAIYVDNTIDGITNGILEMKKNIKKYQKEIKILKKERSEIWEKNRTNLLNKLMRLERSNSIDVHAGN